MPPPFHIILAHSMNLGIGLRSSLPWRLSLDLQHFKILTTSSIAPPFQINLQKKGGKKLEGGVRKEGGKEGNAGKGKEEDGEKREEGKGRKEGGGLNAVIMGRKTFETLPSKFKPLPDRLNIVMSRQMEGGRREGVEVVGGLEEGLKRAEEEGAKNIFVIGGGQIYEEGFKNGNLEQVFVTRVGGKLECDVFAEKRWFEGLKHIETSKTYVENDLPFTFSRYYNPKCCHTPSPLLFSPIMYEQHEELQYLSLIKEVLSSGNSRDDRTGTGTISKFGGMMRFDLKNSFPLITTKDVFWRGVVEELLWFIRGDTNAKNLSEKGVKIWDGNGSRSFLDTLGLQHRQEGDLGPVYGFQWRHFGAKYENMFSDYQNKGIDQIKDLISRIKKDPYSRRLILSAWNPVDLSIMALPPCHVMAQFYVEEGRLSCGMYQRSADIGLGVPFNIASYALLTAILAEVCGLERGEFVHFMGDYHVYKNHVEALKEQIERIPNPFPILKIKTKKENIEDYSFEDFELIGYHPQKKIKMKMAV